MQLALVFLAFSLVSCGPPDEGQAQAQESYKGRRGKSEKSGKRRRRPRPAPEPAPEPAPAPAAPEGEAAAAPLPGAGMAEEDFMFPVEASSGASLGIRLNPAKTKVTITPQPAGHDLRVVAGFSGIASQKGGSLVLNSAAYGKDLVFELSGESVIQVPQGKLVVRGELLATTRGPVVFSVKKNGISTVLCINIINEAEGEVAVDYRESAAAACS